MGRFSALISCQRIIYFLNCIILRCHSYFALFWWKLLWIILKPLKILAASSNLVWDWAKIYTIRVTRMAKQQWSNCISKMHLHVCLYPKKGVELLLYCNWILIWSYFKSQKIRESCVPSSLIDVKYSQKGGLDVFIYHSNAQSGNTVRKINLRVVMKCLDL